MGGLSDIWEDFRKDTLDPLVDSTLTSIGISEEQAEALRQQAGETFNKELETKQSELIKEITGSSMTAQQPTATGTIQAQIEAINKNPVMAAIPGGIYTVAGIAGGFMLYLVLRK
jgi:biotin carboxyl carrier protein